MASCDRGPPTVVSLFIPARRLLFAIRHFAFRSSILCYRRRDMIRVHHLNNSRSQRVLWLLEETGTPYEIVRYERDKKTMLAPQELRAFIRSENLRLSKTTARPSRKPD